MSDAKILSPKVVNVRTEELIKEGSKLNVLAALSIPQVFTSLFPTYFLYFWQKCTNYCLEESGFHKFALGIPRGHAKTTFLKLLIIFIILYTKRTFILVVAASDDLAETILSDVLGVLDTDNIRKIYGDWDTQKEYKRTDAVSFYFRGRNIIIKTKGQGAAFRGIAENYERPDVMIFDDAQTYDCSQSPTQAKKFIEWFHGTALKAKSDKRCFFLYVGNMYKKLLVTEEDKVRGIDAVYGCLLRNLKDAYDWESLIVGAILQDGTALWEEVKPLAGLLEEYESNKRAGMEAIFLAEDMNDDEAQDFSLYDPNLVPTFPFSDGIVPDGAFLIIDPSLGKSKSDKQEVGKVHVINGIPCVMEIRNIQKPAPQLVEYVIEWAIDENIPAIAIEDYAYQASLGDWFEFFIEKYEIEGLNVVLINRGQQAKNTEILSMLRSVMAGYILLHSNMRSRFDSEVRNFDPLKNNNCDNQLDVVSYVDRVRMKFPEEIRCPLSVEYQLMNSSRGGVVDSGIDYK